jgi:hypothetical protein
MGFPDADKTNNAIIQTTRVLFMLAKLDLSF